MIFRTTAVPGVLRVKQERKEDHDFAAETVR